MEMEKRSKSRLIFYLLVSLLYGASPSSLMSTSKNFLIGSETAGCSNRNSFGTLMGNSRPLFLSTVENNDNNVTVTTGETTTTTTTATPTAGSDDVEGSTTKRLRKDDSYTYTNGGNQLDKKTKTSKKNKAYGGYYFLHSEDTVYSRSSNKKVRHMAALALTTGNLSIHFPSSSASWSSKEAERKLINQDSDVGDGNETESKIVINKDNESDGNINNKNKDQSKNLEDWNSTLTRIRLRYPIRKWESFGLFHEDYLKRINKHWLQFEPASTLSHRILAGIYIAIMILGCGGNFLVVFMFVRCRTLRTPANYLVVNLAVSDFFMLAKTPIFIINSFYEGPVFGSLGCQIYGFVGGLTGTASIMTLTSIAVDRYFVIVHPLNPYKKTTLRRALLMIFAVWIYAGFFSSIPLVGINEYTSEGYLTSCSFDFLRRDFASRFFVFVFFLAAWCLPLTLIVFSYVAIFRMVVQAEKLDFFNGANSRESFKYRRVQEKLRKDVKIAILTTFIVLLWIVAWTPYAIVALLGIFGQKRLITPLVSALPALFCKSASVIDPFVYAINHPRFRRELKNKFPIFFKLSKVNSFLRQTSVNQTSFNMSGSCKSLNLDQTEAHIQIENEEIVMSEEEEVEYATKEQREEETSRRSSAFSARFSDSSKPKLHMEGIRDCDPNHKKSPASRKQSVHCDDVTMTMTQLCKPKQTPHDEGFAGDKEHCPELLQKRQENQAQNNEHFQNIGGDRKTTKDENKTTLATPDKSNNDACNNFVRSLAISRTQSEPDFCTKYNEIPRLEARISSSKFSSMDALALMTDVSLPHHHRYRLLVMENDAITEL